MRHQLREGRLAFWLSFGLCLLVCLLFLYGIAPMMGIRQSFGAEAHDGYIELARHLVQGHGFVFEPGGTPVSHRPPLYPFVLMPVVLLPDGWQRPMVVFLHSLMVGGIGWLMFRMASYLLNRDVAKYAVGLLLLNPWLYLNAKNPTLPILLGFLYILFIYFIHQDVIDRCREQIDAKRVSLRSTWWLAGATGGLLSLAHGVMIAVNFAVLMACMVVAIVRCRRELTQHTVFAGLISVIFIAPWTYRN